MTNHAGNEPTAEQLLWELYPDDVMDHNRRANCHLFLEQLRAHGLLSEGTPSEEQARAIRKLDNVQAILAGAQASITDAVRELSLTSAALVAAQGAAPQVESEHQHDGWMIRETGTGGHYCASCGEAVASPRAPVLPSSICQHNMVSYTDSVSEKPENFCSLCGYQPSSGVDEEKLAEVIARVTDLWDDPLDEVHDIPQIARAVAEWLKGQGGESSEAV